MANETFTQLPSVASATMADIICSVQANLSVQETLQQVYNLMLSNIILHNNGNPNGSVAGVVYQLCWDTLDGILYVCTVSGSASTAVWSNSTGASGAISWNEVTGNSVTMSAQNGYVINYSGTVTCTLPATAAFGTVINIVGNQGGWTIAQGSSQYINIGNAHTTTGSGGSLSSTNAFDSVSLICTTSNVAWTCLGSPQSLGLTIV